MKDGTAFANENSALESDPVVRTDERTKEHIRMVAAMHGVSQKRALAVIVQHWVDSNMGVKITKHG